jgi:hypothetical protein
MNQIKLIFVALFIAASVNVLAARECETFTSADYEKAQQVFLENWEKVPGVTALHVAAATGDIEGVKKALAGGTDIDTLDSRNFTAAHLAALREDKTAFNLLKEKGANLKLRNKWFLGAGGFLNVVNLPDPKSQRINLWDESTQSVMQIDGVEFCERTGATFVDGIKLRPQTAMRAWAENTSGEGSALSGFRKTNLEVGSRTAPYSNLYIKRLSDKNGNDLGYGLFATRDFTPGEALSLYEGEWAFEGQNSEYQLDKIDATRLRGYLAFAADGAPNVVVAPLPDRLGVPKVNYAFSVRPIQKNQAIMWDYGQHDIKWEMYSELDPQKVKEYLGSMSLSQWAQSPEAQVSHESLEGMKKLSIFNYVANTPIVFVRLAVEGVMSAEDMSTLHGLQSTIGKLPQASFELFLKGIGLVKKSPEARQFFLEKAKEGNASVLLNSFIYLGHAGKPVTLKSALQKWEEVQEDLCNHKLDRNGRRGGCYLLKKSNDEL